MGRLSTKKGRGRIDMSCVKRKRVGLNVLKRGGDMGRIVKRIEEGDKRIGEFQIIVTQPLSMKRAEHMCKVLDNSPLLKGRALFKVFEAREEVNVSKHRWKKKMVPGFEVRRRVMVGDNVSLISGYDEEEALKGVA